MASMRSPPESVRSGTPATRASHSGRAGDLKPQTSNLKPGGGWGISYLGTILVQKQVSWIELTKERAEPWGRGFGRHCWQP